MLEVIVTDKFIGSIFGNRTLIEDSDRLDKLSRLMISLNGGDHFPAVGSGATI